MDGLTYRGDPDDLPYELKGWIEIDGTRLTGDEVRTFLEKAPQKMSSFGGEFYLRFGECMARDVLGVIPGECAPGEIRCNNRLISHVDPNVPMMELGDAIEMAVRLRSDEGVVALSGGVDSALVGCLAGRECVAIGVDGAHDLHRAAFVAGELGLALSTVTVSSREIEEALIEIIGVIPRVTPVDASIATTLSFVVRFAADHGYRRILAGQGADEIFGGYARYLTTSTLEKDLEEDFIGLGVQGARDQAVAGLHGTYFSLPYLDARVVRAARAIPPEEKVRDGIRKLPLRRVAERWMPHSIAFYEKKAMQYGSGIWKSIRHLARENGYKKSVQGYLTHIGRTEHGIGEGS